MARGGISQAEVRTGTGEGGLVFLEVEKSRREPIERSRREEWEQGGKMKAGMPSINAWSSSAGQEGVPHDFEA